MGLIVIALSTASTCRVSFLEPRLAAPRRSSLATMTLVSTFVSPTSAM
jgi:hypothetical protein